MSNITTTSFTVSWTPITSAILGYGVDVATDPGFVNFLFSYRNKIVTTNSINITNLIPATTYYVRVRSINSIGSGPNSNTLVRSTLCLPPTQITFSEATSNSFIINWRSAIGALNYGIDISKNSDFTDIIAGYNNKIVNSTTEIVENLQPGLRYFVRIRSINNSGNSDNSIIVSARTAPAIPTNLRAFNITNNSFTLVWDNALGANRYRYDISLSSNFATGEENTILNQISNLNTVNVGGILNDFWTGNKTYYIRIRAENESGLSSNSNIFNITTNINSPIVSISNIETNNATINWSSIEGALNYSIDVSLNTTFTSILPEYNNKIVNTTIENLTNLTPGTKYYIRVSANNNSSGYNYSNVLEFKTKPVAPNIPSALLLNGSSFRLNWGLVTGAISYSIDISTNSNFQNFIDNWQNRIIFGNNVDVTNLNSDTLYYVRIRANTEFQNIISNYSNTLEVILIYTPNINLIKADETEIIISWDDLPDVRSIVVEGATENNFQYFNLNTNSLCSTNQSVLGLQESILGSIFNNNQARFSGTVRSGFRFYNIVRPGETYFIRAVVISNDNRRYISNILNVTPKPLDFISSDFNIKVISNTTAEITFDRSVICNSANSLLTYKFDLSTDPNFNSFVPNYQNVELTNLVNRFAASNFEKVLLTGLNSGSVYYFRIKKCANKANNPESNYFVKSFTTQTSIPTNITISDINLNGFLLEWNSVPNAQYYLLDISTINNFSNYVVGFNSRQVNNTNFIVNGLNPGTPYYIRLRSAISNLNISPYSAIETVVITPNPVGSPTFSNISSTSFDVKWSKILGSTYYLLDIATDTNFTNYVSGYQNKIISNKEEEVVNNLNPNTTYYVRIKSANQYSITPNFSHTQSVKTLIMPTPPQLVVNNIQTTSFTVNWASITGASSYRLDVSQNSEFTTFINGYQDRVVNGLFEIVGGLTAGIVVYARVRSVNSSGGTSLNSPVLVVTTKPSALSFNPTVSNVKSDSFTVNWAASGGATSYRLDVATNSTFTNFVSGYQNKTVGGTSDTVTGLVGGTNYHIRVRAVNSGGESSNSPTSQVLTAPNAPVPSTSNVTQNSFVVNWSAVPSATSYRLDISTNSTFTTFVSGYQNKTVNGTSDSVTGLSVGTVYYFRARAINSNGTSDSSTVQTVTTDDPIISLLAPQPIASNIETTSFTVNWASITGASSYRLDVSQNSEFTTFINGYQDRVVNGLFEIVGGLTAGIVVYARVRSVNSSGGTSLNSPVLVVTTKPSALSFNPTVSNVKSDSFTVNWAASGGATSYRLDVATNSTFTNFVSGYQNKTVGGTSDTVTGLVGGTNYHIRVRAVNSGGESSNSPTSQVLTAPDIPTVTVSSITQDSFVVNWSAVPGAAEYYLDVATDIQFTNFVPGYQNIKYLFHINSANIRNLISGNIYYVRVRAVNRHGFSSLYSSLFNSLLSSSSSSSSSSGSSSSSSSSGSSSSSSSSGSSSSSSSNISGGTSGIPTLNITIPEPFATNISSTSNFTVNFYVVPNYSIIYVELADNINFFNSRSYKRSFNATQLLNLLNSIYSEPTQFLGTLEPGTQYYLRIKYIKNNSDSSTLFSPVHSFITIPESLYGYTISNINTNTATISWNSIPGATNYKLFIARHSDIGEGFGNLSDFIPDYNGKIINGISETVSNLIPGTMYFVKVVPRNSSGEADPNRCTIKYFVTLVPKINNYSNVNTNSSSINLELNAPKEKYYISDNLNWFVQSGLNYIVDVSTSQNFNNFIYQNAILGNNNQIFVSNLEPNTNYYLRFKTVLKTFYSRIPYWCFRSRVFQNTICKPYPQSSECGYFSRGQHGLVEDINRNFTECWFPYFADINNRSTFIVTSGINNDYSQTFNFKTTESCQFPINGIKSGDSNGSIGLDSISIQKLSGSFAYMFGPIFYDEIGSSRNGYCGLKLRSSFQSGLFQNNDIVRFYDSIQDNILSLISGYRIEVLSDQSPQTLIIKEVTRPIIKKPGTLFFTNISTNRCFINWQKIDNLNDDIIYTDTFPQAVPRYYIKKDGSSRLWNPSPETYYFIGDEATSYRLDVSTNSNFNNFIPGYNNRIINNVIPNPSGFKIKERIGVISYGRRYFSTEELLLNGIYITGLSAGTTYYARLRSVNENFNGISDYVTGSFTTRVIKTFRLLKSFEIQENLIYGMDYLRNTLITNPYGDTFAVSKDNNYLAIGSKNQDNIKIYENNIISGWSLINNIKGIFPSNIIYKLDNYMEFDSNGFMLALSDVNPNIGGTIARGNIFVKNNNQWVKSSSIFNQNFFIEDLYGLPVAINSNGSTVLFGNQAGKSGAYNGGGIYAYTGSNNNWILKQFITGDPTSSSNNTYGFTRFPAKLGSSITCNNDCSIIVAGGRGDGSRTGTLNNAAGLPANVLNGGAVTIFTGNLNNGWRFKQKITYPRTIVRDWESFGKEVKMSDNGDVLLIASNGITQDFQYEYNYLGEVWIYTGNANNTWTVKQLLTGISIGAGIHKMCINHSGTIFSILNVKNKSINIYTGNSNNGWALSDNIINQDITQESKIKINDLNSIVVGIPSKSQTLIYNYE